MKKLLILILFIVLFLKLYGQEPTAEQFTDRDGLASMTVFKVIQDKTGYIWIATARGITKFDGRIFSTIDLSGLLDREIINIVEDSRGKIWFNNLSGQIGIVDDSSYQLFSPKNENFKGLPTKLFGHDSVLYLTYNNSKLEQNRILKLALDDQALIKESVIHTHTHAFDFIKKFQGNWYDEKIRTIDSKNVLHLISGDGIDTIQNYSNQAFPSLTKRIEFITANSTIFYSQNNWLIKQKGNAASKKVFNFASYALNGVEEVNQKFWILTKNGIYVLNKLSDEIDNHWFKGKTINSVFVDKEQNIWLSTTGNGLLLVRNMNVRPYTAFNSNLQKTDIHSLLFDEDSDNLFVGTSGGFLTEFDQKSKKVVTHKLPFSGRLKTIVKKDPSTLFLGLDDGLCSFDFNKKTSIVHDDEKAIKMLQVGNSMNLWLGTSSHLYRTPLIELDSKKNEIDNILLEKRTNALHIDFEGKVWIGTSNGLFVYLNDNLEALFVEEKPKGYYVNNIVESLDSTIWVATSGNGLLQIKNKKLVQKYTSKDILPSNNCISLATNHELLCIGTDKGLVKYNYSSGKIERLTTDNGLPSNEINCLSIDDQQIYVGTPKGLTILDKKNKKVNEVELPIYLTQLSVNGIDTMFHLAKNLAFTENTVQIGYKALSFKTSQNEKYNYRLLGLDSKWLESNTRSARFHSLPPGKYEFQVQMINERGQKRSKVAKFAFSIHNAWWRSIWFYLSLIISSLGLLFGIFYWRQQDLLQRQKRENELNNRIQSLRMEALQTQMNPHFIYNSLNAIQDFFVTSDDESGLIYLSKFAHLIRQIFENSGSELISLRDEIEFLKLYLDLENLRFGDRIDIKLHIEDTLQDLLDEKEIPPLIIQPVIENAFKHGLKHKLRDGLLEVSFHYVDKDLIKCVIQDNGVGRKFAEMKKKSFEKDRKMSSMEATRKRLEIWKPDSSVNQKFKIIDLENEDGKAIGTKIEIFI